METENGSEQKRVEIHATPTQVLVLLILLGIATFTAGFGWWAFSSTINVSKGQARQAPETAPPASLAAGQQATKSVPPAVPARQTAKRRMALPPVREGFTPQPEATSVKGDPNAPITIVEFSDYQ